MVRERCKGEGINNWNNAFGEKVGDWNDASSEGVSDKNDVARKAGRRGDCNDSDEVGRRERRGCVRRGSCVCEVLRNGYHTRVIYIRGRLPF